MLKFIRPHKTENQTNLKEKLVLPLPVSPNSRLFGGEETLYLGEKRISIPISKTYNEGKLLRLKNTKGNILHSNFSKHEIYFKIYFQKETKKKLNVYLPFPLTKDELSSATLKEISIGGKKLRIKLSSSFEEGKILRLRNINKKLNGIPGDLIFVAVLDKSVDYTSEFRSDEYQNYESHSDQTNRSQTTRTQTKPRKPSTTVVRKPSQTNQPSPSHKSELVKSQKNVSYIISRQENQHEIHIGINLGFFSIKYVFKKN